MWIVILCVILGILAFADASIVAATESVELILYNLLPSLFPFFVLTNMLTHAGKIALFTGFLCGYPAGAMACAQLYKNGMLTKTEATYYSMFTSNAGPTFIVGAIGIGMCASKGIGYLLLGTHLLSALSVAFIARWFFPQKNTSLGHHGKYQPQPFFLGTHLTNAITSALKQIAVVCGYVLFFSVLLSLLQSFGLKSPILFSLLEITTGMNCLLTPFGTPASMPALLSILPFIAMLLGFSGLSIHAQIIAILNQAGLPGRFFVLGKILQGFLSGLYTFFLLQISPLYELLAESCLSVTAFSDMVTTAPSSMEVQLLLIEISITIATYCSALKRRLKRTVSL